MLTKLDRRGTYPLYDLTVSPLTAGPTDTDEARNRNHPRVPGTLYAGRSFATLDVRGPRSDRVLTIAIRDVSGREVWSREIRAAELRCGRMRDGAGRIAPPGAVRPSGRTGPGKVSSAAPPPPTTRPR